MNIETAMALVRDELARMDARVTELLDTEGSDVIEIQNLVDLRGAMILILATAGPLADEEKVEADLIRAVAKAHRQVIRDATEAARQIENDVVVARRDRADAALDAVNQPGNPNV